MEEIWRPVVGWEDLYEVSSFGNVRRTKWGKGTPMNKRGIPMTPWKTLGGYSQVYLCRACKRYPKLLHRLVIHAFLDYSGLEVNHKDGDKTNNRLDNLEYMTRQDNATHAKSQDKYAKGTRCHNAKLTPAKVRAIRERLRSGLIQREIGLEFGVCQGTIHAIAARKIWAWLD